MSVTGEIMDWRLLLIEVELVAAVVSDNFFAEL